MVLLSMRVRNLFRCIKDQNLLHTESLSKYNKEEFIYVDAGWFFKDIEGLVDPSIDIMECYSSCIPIKINQMLGKLDYYGIKAVFVFPGLPYKHNMNLLAGINLSRVNIYEHMTNPEVKFNSYYDLDPNILFLVYNYLKSAKRYVVQAPYLALAQISHFNKKGLCNIAISSPSLLLFGVKTVFTDVDLGNGMCSVAYLPEILAKFGVTFDQFVNAAILSGTEYSFTLESLNKSNFSFMDAIELVKRESFEDLIKAESAKQFDIANKIVVNSLVFDKGIKTIPCNSNLDFSVYAKLVGPKLPDSIYNMLYCGLISPNLLYTLCSGYWMELPDPHVKTEEYRELLEDLRDLHLRCIEIIASKLPDFFTTREYNFVKVADNQWNKYSIKRTLTNGTRGKFVRITAADVINEMARQKVDKVSLLLCLKWHLHSINSNCPLIFDQEKIDKSLHDENSLSCIVLFMFLDNLGYFTIEGGATLYGLALSKTADEFQISTLITLEMLKYGILTSEQLKTIDAVSESTSVKLLCRLASLHPIQLKGRWGLKPHLELSAFNSLVKLITSAMCTLFDACIANVTIDSNIPLTKIIHIKEELCSTASLMGVVFKYFLEYKSGKGNKKGGNLSPMVSVMEQSELEQSLIGYFPSLLQPLEAIKSASKMIISLHGLIAEVGNKADSAALVNELSMAKKFMIFQMQRYALDVE